MDSLTIIADCLKTGEVQQRFFPSEAIVRSSPQGIRQCICAVALQAMEEPALCLDDPAQDWEQYRFTWLRTRHRPVAVCLQRRGLEASVRLKELDGRGGYEFGALSRVEDRAIDTAEWEAVARRISVLPFWTIPSSGEDEGLDGAEWFLEGARAREHRLVWRWSPKPDGPDEPFRAACLSMLAVGRIGSSGQPVY